MGLPSTLAELIATYAAPPPAGGARVLDTDAGEGYALRALGAAWDAETYGAEPSADARIARSGTTRVLWDVFADVRTSKASMSAVVGIVPYGRQALKQRAHAAYLQKVTDVLAPGGLLALVGLPESLDLGACTTLSRWYDAAQAFRLPRSISTQAVIVLAVRAAGKSTGRSPGALADSIAKKSRLPELADAAAPLTTLPALGGQFVFGPSHMEYAEVAEEAAAAGVWAQSANDPILLRAADRSFQPVMPLRKGHLALLVAGGLFDNLTLKDGRRTLVVKGRTLKVRDTQTDGNGRSRETERFRVQVSVLDMRDGSLRLLHDS